MLLNTSVKKCHRMGRPAANGFIFRCHCPAKSHGMGTGIRRKIDFQIKALYDSRAGKRKG